MRLFAGSIINIKWWYALKGAIRFKSIRYSIEITKKKTKIKKALVKGVKAGLRSGCASQILTVILAVNQHHKTDHKGYIIKAKQRAMGQKGIKAAGWARVVEVHRDNDAKIGSLTNQ